MKRVDGAKLIGRLPAGTWTMVYGPGCIVFASPQHDPHVYDIATGQLAPATAKSDTAFTVGILARRTFYP